jgi:hypothetical protein
MLKKSLYGMKQAGWIWNQTMNKEMVSCGFKRILCKWCIYWHKTDKGVVTVGVHVDDYVAIGSSRWPMTNSGTTSREVSRSLRAHSTYA